MFCGKKAELVVPTEGLKRYTEGGAYIQDAFPTLSSGQRELMLTGTCPSCWSDAFGDD